MEPLIRWLNELYLLEKTFTRILDSQQTFMSHDQELAQRLSEDSLLSRKLAENLRDSIIRMGGKVGETDPKFKRIIADIRNIDKDGAFDNPVKKVIFDLLIKDVEIMYLRTLLSAALHLGDIETVSLCQKYLNQQNKTIAWYEQYLPVIVQEYLHQNPQITHSD